MTTVNQFTFLSEASATGASAVLDNGSGEGLVVGVSGTFVATIKAQGCLIDGEGNENWYDLVAVKLSDGTKVESIEAEGAYAVPCAYGFNKLRLNVTAYTSGEISAVGRLCRT